MTTDPTIDDIDCDNPTETDEPDRPNFDLEKEAFLREFLSRQRELNKKSLAAVASLASANIELILRSGMVEVAAKRVAATMLSGGKDTIAGVMAQHVDATDALVDKITRAINPYE